jgi:hypothetical protein
MGRPGREMKDLDEGKEEHQIEVDQITEVSQSRRGRRQQQTDRSMVCATG